MMDKATQTDWSWLQDQITSRKTSSHMDEADTSPAMQNQQMNSAEEDDEKPNSSEGKEEVTRRHSSLSDLIDKLNLAHSEESDSDQERGDEPMAAEDESEGEESSPPYASLTDNLPWPRLLQYLRESESTSSKYFSVGGLFTSSPKLALTDNGDQNAIADNRQCHFCGKKAFQIEPTAENPEFCCDSFKDYCILVAVYTKKMMDDKLNRKPGKIPLQKGKVKFKKTAQERALERVRRKSRWEEVQRNKLRILESSNLHVPRQNRIIHFSLEAQTCMTKDWTEKTVASASLRKKQPVLQHTRPLPALSHEQLERIAATVQMKKEDLQFHKYSTGHLSMVSLPDTTGQCYYPSGNLAVVKLPIYPTVMSYLVYQDEHKGSLIGYFDEIGRGWLSREDNSMRLLSTLSELYLFEWHGRIKHMAWSDPTAAVTSFLPLVLKINRYLTIKYSSQDDVMISFVSEQHQQKFKIMLKLKETHLPVIDKKLATYKIQLEKMKLRFKLHLSSLERTGKLLKTASLPPIRGNLVKRSRTEELKRM